MYLALRKIRQHTYCSRFFMKSALVASLKVVFAQSVIDVG